MKTNIDLSNDTITEKDRRRISKIKIALMRNPAFVLWSGIMMIGKTAVVNNIPTACTDGRNDYYGIHFMRMLEDKELAFVVLHETMHKAYRHLTVWEKLFKIDAALAGEACDHVINNKLKALDPHEQYIAFPKLDGEPVGCCDPQYRDMHTKQVFDLLRQQQKKKGKKGKSSEGGEGGSGSGREGSGDPRDSLKQGKSFDEHQWKDASEMTAKDKQQLAKEIDQGLRQGKIASNKLAGSGKGYGDRDIDELLTPKVDWRELLREFMVNTCRTPDSSSWRRPNRRFLHQGIYMPTLIGEAMGNIVIAVDTSGSISQKEVTCFLSEVVGICELVKPTHVDLMYWGSHVANHEEYTSSNLSDLKSSTKVADGGGTSPSVITDYLDDKKIDAECVVILTDGYVGNDWGGNWRAPTIWVVLDNDSAIAANGKTIHLSSEDM